MRDESKITTAPQGAPRKTTREFRLARILLISLFSVLLPYTAAHASTLRLTTPTDTAFAPGVTDDTVVVGDTFILELWADCSDTDVNGAEATIVFDGTKLELLESADATDSFFGGIGINSDEDHTVFGDIHMNTGISAGTATDTARYAALPYVDSTRANTRLVRFTFQIRPTASTGITSVTFRSTAEETTAVTAADALATNVLTGTDTGIILVAAGPDTHAVLTLVAPLAGEYFAIYNATDQALDLSKFYVSSDDSNYITTTTAAPAVSSGNFIARFPNGATLAAGDTVTVALSSDTFHRLLPGVAVDYELDQDGTNGDSVVDMTMVATNGTRRLGDAGGALVLFYWDGSNDLVRDVDILAWGTGTVPNKTGKSIDGIDAGTETSTYANDSALMTRPAAPPAGQVLRRTAWISGDTATNEPLTNGNGLTNHDETSESCSVSWGASTDTIPWHTMLVASKRGDFAASTAYRSETNVAALSFTLKGAFGRAENLTQLDVTNLGTADTANVETVALWIDANADSIIGAGDTLVGALTATSTKTWRYIGALALPAGAGYNFVIGFDVDSTVETGETVKLSIAPQGILTSVSDSGSFIAITNAATITLSNPVVIVETAATIASGTILAGDVNVTVMAVNVRSNMTDTLTSFAVANGGKLDSGDVSIYLWRDANASLAWDAGDTAIGQLAWSAANARWETTAMVLPLVASGETLIVTINVAANAAVEGDSFLAWIPAASAKSTWAETGPVALVSNLQEKTLINPPGIANHIVIAAVYPNSVLVDANGEWLLLYNPTDTPQNLQNWSLRDAGAAAITLPDSTIAAHGWFLITDNAFVKDNPNWPNGDVTGNLGLNNTNEGLSLYDSSVNVIDRFGYGTAGIAAPDYEGTPAANSVDNSYAIYVRKAHPLSTQPDILQGGRDEFGGMAYDSYDNSTDFILFSGSDTQLWTLRNSASAVETPAAKTTVVKIATDLASDTFTLSQTNRLLMRLYIQGDTTASGTLQTFRIEATDTMADTNFASVRLYRDQNADLLYDAGDSLVATLSATGQAAWETTGLTFSFNALAGETFLVVADIASFVTDGETFQPRIAVRTIGTADVDSGPSIVRTSAAVFTLLSINPIIITKGPNVTSETVVPTADTLTVIAFHIVGEPTGDTLTVFEIANNGSLDTGDIAAVRLWQDANNDSTWSSGDTLISTLTPSDSKTWRNGALSTYIGTGADFLVTIDLGNAGDGETFQAIIRATTVDGSLSETGPASNVTEAGVFTVSAVAAVQIILSEVNVATGTDYVELWVLDDGNGGAGVNVAGWKITEYPSSSTDSKVLGDTDGNGSIDTAVFARTGDRIVIYDIGGIDSDVAFGGVINVYSAGLTLTSTNDEVILIDLGGTSRDAVVWSDRSGAHSDAADLAAIIAAGLWEGTAATENVCVTPRTGTSFTNGNSIQRGGSLDRDTYLDWGEAPITPGETNSVESPCVTPARITTLNLIDLPDDLGGTLQVSWTPDTSNADFLEYRIYLETYPLDSLLDTNVTPRTTITDSSLGIASIGSLTNGESYYAVVTAADSWGLEFRFGLSDTGPAAPAVNITGTPRLLLNEINITATGGADTDYIEIFVADDGNPTGNLNLAGWQIEWHTGGTKTLGSITAATGDYIVLDFNSAAADDSDSSGDGVINVYDASTGLTGTAGYARIKDSTDSLIDFVFFSGRLTSPAAAVYTATREAIDTGMWQGDTVTNAAVNSSAVNGSISSPEVLARDGVSSDTTNSRNDWNVTGTRTKGTANTGVPTPIVVPDSRLVTVFRDVPDDFGGSIEIAWETTTALASFVRYNIYLETTPIGTRIDTSTIQPRTTISDSSTGLTSISGLTNWDSHYLVITVTDSWGHERRLNLTETGPVAPVKDISGTPNLLFTEVKFAGTSTTEFIEIRVIDDGNPAGSLNLVGMKVTKDDTSTGDIATLGSVTVSDSDFIVLWNIAGTSETDSGGDGVINIYNLTISLAEGDENLFLIHPAGDTILDFVNWSTRSGGITVGELPDINYAIAMGAWANLSDSQNNARNPLEYTNFYDSGSITRDRLFSDNNSDTDWAIDWNPTPGALTSFTEAPFAAPTAIIGLTAIDAPADFGGKINLSWTASGAPDLGFYNIYRETAPIPASLYNSNLYPRDTAAKTDTSKVVTGLLDGETYYFAVTAVDTWGMERKTGLVVDSAVPIVNVSGETLLITEVSFKEVASGVIGNDWIEIYVQNDGNGGAGIDLTSWKIITTAAANPSKTIAGVTARTGDYILIHSAVGSDETDSGGDGVINLYFGATGLTGTDNTVTFFKPTGDTEDFVAWTEIGGAPVNATDSQAIAISIAAGQWTDINADGINVYDGVSSDSASANWSIIRSPDTTDLNTMADWTIDSSPTPGARNDSITYWRVIGTLDLETRAADGGCTVTASNGIETHVVFTDATGTYVLRIPNGTWSLTGDTTHYLRRIISGITVNNASLFGQNIGTMYAGDANGDNQINIFDAAITNFAIDYATGNPAADHVDPAGTINASDLDAVRTNFGRKGD